MKTVLILAGLVALSLAGTVPHTYEHVNLKSVDADFVLRQRKVLAFFENLRQYNTEAEYFKIGMEYNIEANIDNYTNKKAVEEFLYLYKGGLLRKYAVFSIFYDRMREEAIALFHLFYYAKDFDTFYKTAAFARVHLNEYLFIYSFYTALVQRPDTQGIIVPAPYEVYPEFFMNSDVLYRIERIAMQDGIQDINVAHDYGIFKEDNHYTFYANYSYAFSYDNEEQRLSYFTEDIGLNAYYYYFHSVFPFWLSGDQFALKPLSERRGEVYYFYYQQLLARYYLERLSNGLGEIPEFSYHKPIKTGYTPFMRYAYLPFIQRNEDYNLVHDNNIEDIQFLDFYEKNFLQYLQRGEFKAFNQEVYLAKDNSIDFVGNYFQGNADLYQKSGPRNFYRSYEAVARYLLSACPKSIDRHTILPSPLSFYQTSLRDPMFYQLYNRIMKYIFMYKEYSKPYSPQDLHYTGVKINDVHVDKLVTFFDFYEYDASNAVFYNAEELKTMTPRYIVRQPRLNYKPFSVTIDVKSEVTGDAVVKLFMAPKYDGKGYPITLEDNYMNFVELEQFVYNLKKGQNQIVRQSEDFYFYKEDSVPITQLYKFLEQGKVPVDMSEGYYKLPNRLMLPRGSYGGFPIQFFVMVYPLEGQTEEYKKYGFPIDNKPFGYPFDRPIFYADFMQPNMFLEDVSVYFEGEYFPYTLNNPFYVSHNNEVLKH